MDWNWIWPTGAAIGIVLAVIPIIGLYLTFIERKVAAYIQDRVGPNRVGPFGLLQAVADGIKIFLKEQVVPQHVSKAVYFFAPAISLICAMMCLAVIPFGPIDSTPKEGFRAIIAPGVDIGILFVMGISSLSAYGVILGGWASNNKYSLFGAVRSCAQFISYEIPLGLSILGVIMATGSLNIERITMAQSQGIADWNIWWQPLAALIFFTAALAETNRLPFDLPECEQELVGGFHTEYSGIKFVLFFLAEYTHVVGISFLVTLLFLGGWHFPGLTVAGKTDLSVFLLQWAALIAKVLMVVAFIIQLRWTLPRFRFDQLMKLAWCCLVPLGVANFLGVAVILSLDLPRWLMSVYSLVCLAAAAIFSVRSINTRQRQRVQAGPAVIA